MIVYRFNIYEALEKNGFNTYKAKQTKLLSADTMQKLKNDDTNITLKSLNNICMLLDMQPKDIIMYKEEKEK